MENIDQITTPHTNSTTELPPLSLNQSKKPFFIGFSDYLQALKKWELLSYVAYADIRKRYRRTVIGPFWATLSLAIFVTSMGILFSLLWHTNVSTYLPFFASGFIVWTFFSAMIIESCVTFTSAEGYLKQVSMPYSFYAFLVICRNFIVFLHQFVIYLVIAFIFRIPVTHYTWLTIPSFFLLILNASWITIALGLLCSRFRDVQQIINSVLQIAMFVTPLFWPEKQLGHSIAAFLCIDLNPFYHFVSIVRYPLLGEPAPLISWFADIFILVIGWTFTMYSLGRYYNKLIYWL